MAVAGLSVMIYAILMKRMIKVIGEKRLLISNFVLFIVIFLFYPYLYDLWMVFAFILPFSFCMALMRPLITSNMTKAVGLNKQGELSGWSTNFQAVAQTIAPLIATSFLQIGGLAIGFIYLDSYHLIGFTTMILALLLFIIGYLDIKKHPKLYYYEKLRKKREAMRKRKIKEEKLNKKTVI
jgi:DHA1 family tetracycline resistance protein-like MFS transporter